MLDDPGLSKIEGGWPRITVVILNWNGKTDTLECLKSIKAICYPNFETVVVDNGSEDDSVFVIRNSYPDITVLETGINLGYAGGNNVGMRWALERGATYVLLLNNDTVVDPDILNSFVQAAKELKDGGLFGAKIFYYDEPNTLWNAGADWVPALGQHRTRGSRQVDGAEFNDIVESAYANGCALFASADVLREVGLLDESFFLIYEETDLSYRARKSGYKIYFVPNAKVWHKVSVSIGGYDSPIARYFNSRNQLLWAGRHLKLRDRLCVYRHVFSRLRMSFIPPFYLGNMEFSFLRRFRWGLNSWIRQFQRNILAPGNRADLMGVRDYLFSRFGDCPTTVRHLAELAKTKTPTSL